MNHNVSPWGTLVCEATQRGSSRPAHRSAPAVSHRCNKAGARRVRYRGSEVRPPIRFSPRTYGAGGLVSNAALLYPQEDGLAPWTNDWKTIAELPNENWSAGLLGWGIAAPEQAKEARSKCERVKTVAVQLCIRSSLGFALSGRSESSSDQPPPRDAPCW